MPGWQVVLQRRPGRPDALGPRRTCHGRSARTRHAPRSTGSASRSRARRSARCGRCGRARSVEPDRAETRILSAAADQLGQAVVRDRLTQEATSAEIARQSEALKTALLDSVSHDLRTPLATIRAAAGSMLDEAVKWTPDDQREAFQAIDAEAERMGRLVRNLLDLSRIEGGALKPELEPCDLDDVVRQAVKRPTPTRASDIVVELPESLPPVLADELYLGQVLANLLENAIRYGGETIRVRGCDRADGLVEISVEDDGRACRTRPCRTCSRSSTRPGRPARRSGGAWASA